MKNRRELYEKGTTYEKQLKRKLHDILEELKRNLIRAQRRVEQSARFR